MHDVAVRVGEDLHLDVARLVDVLLDEQRSVAEGGLGFGSGFALRPLQFAGFAVAGAMVVSAALLALARSSYIAGGVDARNQVLRRVVWDALLEGYLLLAAIVAGIGVLVGIGMWWLRRRRAA